MIRLSVAPPHVEYRRVVAVVKVGGRGRYRIVLVKSEKEPLRCRSTSQQRLHLRNQRVVAVALNGVVAVALAEDFNRNVAIPQSKAVRASCAGGEDCRWSVAL